VSGDAAGGLEAITIDEARQYGEEADKGSIEVGKRADLVILSGNPLTVEPATIKDIRVEETLEDGATVVAAMTGRGPRAYHSPSLRSRPSTMSAMSRAWSSSSCTEFLVVVIDGGRARGDRFRLVSPRLQPSRAASRPVGSRALGSRSELVPVAKRHRLTLASAKALLERPAQPRPAERKAYARVEAASSPFPAGTPVVTAASR